MKIKTQDKITLFSALLVGVITGSYLYVVGFAPEFESTDVPSDNEAVAFSLVGEKYDTNQAGIPASFQLRDDGSYRYLPASPNPESPLPAVEGELSRAQLNAVRSTLSEKSLAEIESSATENTCVLPDDTTGYRYFVTMAGVEYQLDSCTDDFSIDEAVDTVLFDLWNVLEGQSE